MRARPVLVFVALALVGELGHRFFLWTGWTGAHHLFHFLYGAGALVVFSRYVVHDIRRNGVPRFSWHLRPEAAPARREE